LRGEPLVTDGLSARLAGAVRSISNSTQGKIQFGEVRSRLAQHRVDLCAFVGNRRTFGIVLVISRHCS
jgi:hypothetical protein